MSHALTLSAVHERVHNCRLPPLAQVAQERAFGQGHPEAQNTIYRFIYSWKQGALRPRSERITHTISWMP